MALGFAWPGAVDPVRLCRDYLRAMEEGRHADAAAALSPDYRGVWPGGLEMCGVEDIVASGRGRYSDVRKTFLAERRTEDGGAIQSGTLAGRWADGAPFEGIRFADIFRVEGGLIVEQQVLNDLALFMPDRD